MLSTLLHSGLKRCGRVGNLGCRTIGTRSRSGGSFVRAVPDASLAVITTAEGTVKVWDWSADTVIWELSVASRLGRPSVSPDGTRFAIVVDDFIQEYYLDVDRLLAELATDIRSLTETECLT